MAESTKIEWCDATFNAWEGCTKVSAGCANCYAETFSGRNPKVLGVWGPNGTRVVAAEAQWREPLKWNEMAREGVCPHCHGKSTRDTPGKCPVCDGTGRVAPYRARVFCASLADVFESWAGPMRAANGQELFWPHNSMNAPRWIPDEDCGGGEPAVTMQDVRARLFEVIDATPNLDWLLLTKHPENIAGMLPDYTQHTPGMRVTYRGFSVARPNVWLGTSVENQEAADERIPHLLRVPAAVRFLSCEPLLGPVELREGLGLMACPGDVDWVIVGGESGPGARPMNIEWARSLVQQCKAAGVACFVKQLGERPVRADGRPLGAYDAEEGEFPRCSRCGHFDFGPCGDGTLLCNGCDSAWSGLRDKKGGNPDEWPADLRVREFPEVKVGAA